ncbi:MAG: PhoH family protein [Phycisphaeraceae bacterium]|nr:PhoH family protein [Phycisphaeraceae bacterium]
MIREALGVKVVAREGEVHLSGDRGAVTVARNVMERLRVGHGMSRQQVLELIAEESGREAAGRQLLAPARTPGPGVPSWGGPVDVFVGGRRIESRSPNQEAYLEAIRTNDLVFAIGPAGTGKTYLAVAAAVHMLKADLVRRIVLVRPAVEAGEKLGFLPGDLVEKVNPYLRPLLDSLHDMIDYGTLRRFMGSDVIEIAPLAFMRGRTLNNAAIILDEAQNSTAGQMKMFLTRMGNGSKMIVTGDVTQIDLEDPTQSGLVDAARRLRRVSGVSFVTLDRADVVRHPLVQRIVEAYGEDRGADHGS